MTGMIQDPVIIAHFYSKLNDFREAGEYVDVSVQCEDRIFHCHKLVLAIASDYFRAMFAAGNFRESTATTVVLHEIDAKTFELILRFIYSGHIIINSDNVCSLLRASDFIRIQNIEDLCLKFIREMRATVENISDIFVFARSTSKSELLAQIESLYILPHLSIFSKTDIFLEATFEYMSRILEQYTKTLPTRNDITLLNVVMQWICHRRERLQYLDKFLKMIQLDNISLQSIKLMAEKVIAVNSVSSPTEKVTDESVDFAEIRRLLPVLKYETFLHVCIRFYRENTIEIFSVDSDGDCPNDETVPVPLPPKFHHYGHVTVNDSYIYRLQYVTADTRAKNVDIINETFSVTNSIRSTSWLALAPLPVEISSGPRLCNVGNNIYLGESNPKRISNGPTSVRTFTDEELSRCVYGYNCDLDKWFAVPPMKKKLNSFHLTACGEILYIVGQGRYEGSVQETLCVQAYDFRIGDWQELPASNIQVECDDQINGCCSLGDKIYAAHCDETHTCQMERYDIIGKKWESINTDNLDNVYYPEVTPYRNKIWMIEYRDRYIPFMGRNTQLHTTIYDPLLNTFSDSRNLGYVVDDYMEDFTRFHIIDCFVFRK